MSFVDAIKAIVDSYDNNRYLRIQSKYYRAAPITHRSGVTVADKLPAPGLSTQDVVTGGSLNANTTYYLGVSPSSTYGARVPTITSKTTANDSSNTHMIDLGIEQVANAVSYEIFCSVDSAPKWIAKITEAQRAAGCKISSVGGTPESPSAGVAAGTVRIAISHAALGSNESSQTNATQFGYDQSYVMPTPEARVQCAGYNYATWHIKFEWDDLRSTPLLVLVFFAKESGQWSTCGTLKFPEYAKLYGQIGYQDWEMPVRGATEMCVLVDHISGQGARVTIKASQV